MNFVSVLYLYLFAPLIQPLWSKKFCVINIDFTSPFTFSFTLMKFVLHFIQMINYGRNVVVNSRQDRRELTSPASSRSASRESRPTDTGLERTALAAGPVKTSVVELSADELERKTKSLIEEYLHLNDLKVSR